MKNIYIFSGLGADKRVFQLMDFSDFDAVFIEWIQPKTNERIEDYTLRLTEQIKTKNPILVGLSFGGIIAIEIAKFIETEKIILIASAKNKFEIPLYFRLLGKLKIHKFVPTNLLKRQNFITNWFFGVQNDRDKQLLGEILNDTNPDFIKWAIDKILKWTNVDMLKNLTHIHGTEDKILPIKYVNFNIKILGGGHLMTLNKANELTEIIRNELK